MIATHLSPLPSWLKVVPSKNKRTCASVWVGKKGKPYHFCPPVVHPYASESSQSSVAAAFCVVWIILLERVLSPVQLRVSCLSLGTFLS